MAKITDKTVKSKYPPKQTNVTWIDLSGKIPVMKSYIKGEWVPMNGNGGSGQSPKIIKVSDIENIDSEILNSLNAGDFIISEGPESSETFVVTFYNVEEGGNDNIKHIFLTGNDINVIQTIEYYGEGNDWQIIDAREYNLNDIYTRINTIQPASGMRPNTLYNLGTLSSNITFSLYQNVDDSICNHWYWTFNTSDTAPTITWPADILVWNGDEPPTINENKHYEISVLGGVASYIETEIPTNE